MAIYNVHGGHSLICRGASKYLDEVNEDRKVKNKVIQLLRDAGHTVYDCTDDAGKTAKSNLNAIVSKCNQHKVDLDISIHLNAGGGTGTEVFVYNDKTKAVAARIASKISEIFGIRNRGVKQSTGLYVLRETLSPAILIECCFVDSYTDSNVWDADKCATAIVEGLLNLTVTNTVNNNPPKTQTSDVIRVKIDSPNLNIRKGPGTNYDKTGSFTGKGTFTIVDIQPGIGSKNGWGKLKSGAGWISLDYTKRI